MNLRPAWGQRVPALLTGLCAACLAIPLLFSGVPDREQLAEPRSPMFELMDEVRRLEAAPLWPGFEPGAVPVALFDGLNTYLFNFPAKPKGFLPLEGRPGTLFLKGRYPAVVGNRLIQIDGIWVATSIPQTFSPITQARYTPAERAAVIIHEKFHVFQKRRHPDWRPNDAGLFDYPLDTEESLALKRMEVEATCRAVTAERDEDAAGWASSALDIRRQRLAALPERHAVYEQELQLLEGLAEYIQYVAGGRDFVDGPPISGFAPKSAREMGYLVGRWNANLLDRFDGGWKERLEAGEFRYLEERLETILRDGRAAKTFSSAEVQGFREDAAVALRDKEEGREELVKELYGRFGGHVEFLAEESPLRLEMFDPFTLEAVGPRKMIHKTWLILKNENGVIEVLNRPCLTEVNDRGQVIRLVITGLTKRRPLAQQAGQVVLTHDGITAVFKKIRVSERGNRFYVFLRK
ncbi:MAG: hypothetical protein OEW18_05995 [Candidatus Aminicenantes bacterium]|nr:hypothetical protein [Candidatus Aminicenantes bacterium]